MSSPYDTMSVSNIRDTEGGNSRETDALLAGNVEQTDNNGHYPPDWSHDLHSATPNPHSELPVYKTIHRIHRDIIASIEDPYTFEQLKDPRMNVSIVRPLVNKLYDLQDISVVYCLMVNRVQFLREQSYQAHHQTTNITRALLCELVAQKILRRFDEDNPGPKGLLLLSNVLVAGFDPFQNAPPEVIAENAHAFHWMTQKKGGYERKLTALEIAIISEAKNFLASSACQKVVDAIYIGRVIYTPTSFIDILPDHYKQKPISLYNPRKAPLFNQYRLIVPRTRNLLEVAQFVILLILYFLLMTHRNAHVFSTYEALFVVYTLGWVLDQFASILEHGFEVYTQNLWAFLDVTFIIIYLLYAALRIQGFHLNDIELGHQAIDVLCMGGPVLVPRLAFNLMSENMLFVSLRAMMRDFTVLTILAIWCFAGFLLAMLWLSRGLHTSITISKWMLWVWFGLDGTGIQRSTEFHEILGPILMIAFAFLGNTLFLTILVSMLSHTFSTIVSNAAAEIQFRRAVLTFEGVKSDSVFYYQPPSNLLALFILLPLKFIFSPRWFHKINVFIVKALNAPLLLLIAAFERRMLWSSSRRASTMTPAHPSAAARKRSRWAFWAFQRFSVHGDIQAVFEDEPPKSIRDEIAAEDHFDSSIVAELPLPSARAQRPVPERQKSRGGVTGQVKAMLEEFGRKEGTNERLERLEASCERIEALLERVCREIGEGGRDD